MHESGLTDTDLPGPRRLLPSCDVSSPRRWVRRPLLVDTGQWVKHQLSLAGARGHVTVYAEQPAVCRETTFTEPSRA